MDTRFKIVKTYLKNLFLNSPNSPAPFSGSPVEIAPSITISIDSENGEDSSTYSVKLQTSAQLMEGAQGLNSISMIYVAWVEIADKDINKDELDRILYVDVPQSLYNPMRSLVWTMTTTAGLTPVIFNDYDFAASYENVCAEEIIDEHMQDNDSLSDFDCNFCADNNEDTPGQNGVLLGYDWIVRNVHSPEDEMPYFEFIEDISGGTLSYKELPLYKYYYRFLIPIEYRHPDFDECEDSFWPFLFQLLFAEGKGVKVIADKNHGVPEIEFADENDNRRTVSSLTFEELKTLAMNLAAIAFSNTNLCMYRINFNEEYYETIPKDQLILKEEMLSLYNCNQPDANWLDVKFVEKIYSRIKDCDLQTFIYRFW